MRKAGVVWTGILLAGVIGMLIGCGREEPAGQIGIDGYAYVAEKVKLTGSWYGVTACRVTGNGLYYSENNEGVGAVKRISLKTIENALEKTDMKGDMETIYAVSTVPVIIPEGENVQEPEDYGLLLDQAMDPKRLRTSGNLSRNMVWEPDKEYCSFYLNDFAVEENKTVTYSLDIYRGNYAGMELVGSVLGRKDKDGQEIFRMYFPMRASFAIDGKGRTFLLQDQIWVLDEKGQRMDTVDTEKFRKGDYEYEETLFGNGEGNIYYRIRNGVTAPCELLEKNGKLVLKELEGLPLTAEDLFAEPGGNILFTMGQEDGVLYEWDREDVGVRPLLRWQDVDVLPYEVRAVAPIGEGRLILLSSGTDSEGMFVLRKMSVEELPKKEAVVLASLYPDTQLLQTVRKFNQLSNEYRVVVERYGATGYRNGVDDDTSDVYRDAVNRLDAALVSSDPPDMLDLNDMDIRKYADKEALEDLAPRLEEMGIYKEDYLENVWEGFTVGGKLVCLPSEVWLSGIFYGRASQAGGSGTWTMEDVYELTERCPDKELIYGAHKGDLLDFCSAYYLERFIDWNTGKCSFDSPEFRKILVWAEEHSREEGDYAWLEQYTRVPEDILLVREDWYFRCFYSALESYTQFGEDIRFLGTPTVDGKGKFSYMPMGALGIASNAAHKEGAYRFLEYFLTVQLNPGNKAYSSFSTRKAWLEECAEEVTEKKWKLTGTDGLPVKEYGYAEMYTITLDGEEIGYSCIPSELVDQVTDILEGIDFSPERSVERQIKRIVKEEAASYYDGTKTLEETSDIIQSRVQILVQENLN